MGCGCYLVLFRRHETGKNIKQKKNKTKMMNWEEEQIHSHTHAGITHLQKEKQRVCVFCMPVA